MAKTPDPFDGIPNADGKAYDYFGPEQHTSRSVAHVTDDWDTALAAARRSGEALGRGYASWGDLPAGDGEQLLREVAEAWLGAALRAFQHERAAVDRRE